MQSDCCGLIQVIFHSNIDCFPFIALCTQNVTLKAFGFNYLTWFLYYGALVTVICTCHLNINTFKDLYTHHIISIANFIFLEHTCTRRQTESNLPHLTLPISQKRQCTSSSLPPSFPCISLFPWLQSLMFARLGLVQSSRYLYCLTSSNKREVIRGEGLVDQLLPCIMGLCNHLQRVCLARYVTNHNNHEYLCAELNSDVCKILVELNNPLFQHNIWSGVCCFACDTFHVR